MEWSDLVSAELSHELAQLWSDDVAALIHDWHWARGKARAYSVVVSNVTELYFAQAHQPDV